MNGNDSNLQLRDHPLTVKINLTSLIVVTEDLVISKAVQKRERQTTVPQTLPVC